ncbi:pimeloyl-ACP methyl ester carboxylesterase [Nocardioides sp. BE266]|uniref:alpha/beta fold hydrolase n=1 Tax=Nocardioides sp. BE266 TaxID=2817725 RepID=UPI00285ADBA1|nr:alpha/beta hydrolase [Nocardioides sp. BE266]MDR7255467.1 pimeloyl-ACP methyl ester carboxylesterase [Nocardioides sp. BE266]
MDHASFTAVTESGELGGRVVGDGPRVLALHGGPGLGYEYLGDVVDEVAARYRVATFQQRGLAPSTLDGEFTIAEAISDIVAVLDALGWATAYVMGHSWGGHLAFHAAAAIPERLDGILAVDPLGAVADGGAAAFGAELVARMKDGSRAALAELTTREEAEGLSLDEEIEQLRLLWPSYFADPATAPEMPPIRMSPGSSGGLWGDLVARLPELEAALPTITVPTGVLAGEGSPIPTTAATDTADRIPGAWSSVVPGAGHFVWIESPGTVLAAMDRLVRSAGRRTRARPARTRRSRAGSTPSSRARSAAPGARTARGT